MLCRHSVSHYQRYGPATTAHFGLTPCSLITFAPPLPGRPLHSSIAFSHSILNHYCIVQSGDQPCRPFLFLYSIVPFCETDAFFIFSSFLYTTRRLFLSQPLSPLQPSLSTSPIVTRATPKHNKNQTTCRMLLRPFLAAAGLTAVANAFLVPPELSSAEIEAFESVPVESLAIAQTQSISLDCPGCPPVFHKKHHGDGKPKHHKQHKQHKQHSSHLELDFSVADAQRLLVNGFELYPNSDPFSNVLVALQVSDKHKKQHHNKHHKDDEKEGKALKSHHKFRPHEHKPKTVEQQLGFSLQTHPVAQTADEGMDLVVVDLQIIEVGSVFVDGLPNIRVHLIKSPDNQLLIAKIEQTASENAPTSDDQKCTSYICQWRAIIASQLEKLKAHGCAGMMGALGGHGGAHSHHHHGHHGQQPGHMTQHNRQHRWTLLFRKLTSHIILPVLVGIVAGVSVSILGMLVGTVLVGLWRKFVRGQSFFPSHHCRRLARSSHHKASRQEAAFAEEKSGLMANQEELPPPPSYEDEPEPADRV